MIEEWLMLVTSHVCVLIVGLAVGHAHGYTKALIYSAMRIKTAAMVGYTFGVRDLAEHQVAKDVDTAIALVETEMKQQGL